MGWSTVTHALRSLLSVSALGAFNLKPCAVSRRSTSTTAQAHVLYMTSGHSAFQRRMTTCRAQSTAFTTTVIMTYGARYDTCHEHSCKVPRKFKFLRPNLSLLFSQLFILAWSVSCGHLLDCYFRNHGYLS